MIKLYSYFRSSTSFRVRIVLNLKKLSYEIIPVHLLKDGGQQHSASYLALNPAAGVPTLDHDGNILTQSSAICEYLNELQPEPALLPADKVERAWVRSVCNVVACDIHPVNNLRVLNYLTQNLRHDETQKMTWYRHWVAQGFGALEKILSPKAGRFCWGDTLTMADVFVTPQVWSAHRFKMTMDDYPTLQRIFENAMQLPEFQQAAPAAQADAE
jgi:maleylacetoacetate isomerase